MNSRYIFYISLFLTMNNFTGLNYIVKKTEDRCVNDNLLETIKKCHFNRPSLSCKIRGLHIAKLA
jgi:hypothetical protein